MRSTSAQILETALALQRAPGERFRLRERPLTPGIIHLMEIAAGSPQALQAAAAELGEAEPALVEAARFYLEQVLFADPEADAYRILGVPPHVQQETIRVHQRWLQRWLHPDRALAGDASVFATRVNHAYAQVRTAELRHAYDVRLAEARLAGASAPIAEETLRRWEGGDDRARSAVGRRSRWLLATALISCAVLAVLIVRNPDNIASWEEGVEEGQAPIDVPRSAPAIEDRDFGILDAALALPAAERMPGNRSEPHAPIAPSGPPPVMRAAASRPLDASGQAASAYSPLVRQAKRPVAATATAVAMPGSVAPREHRPASARIPETPDSAQLHRQPTENIAASIGSSSALGDSSLPEATLAMQRMQLARQRADQVAGYLGASSGVYPLWNDPDVEASADRIRGAINARGGSFGLSGAVWKLDADRATLNADYACRTASAGPCEGRLILDLVWREGLWFVRRIALAPSA